MSTQDNNNKNSNKQSTQSDTFRCRINNDAKAMMSGMWNDVKKPYKPKEIKDGKSVQWCTEVQRQEKLNKWIAAAQKPSKSGSIEESRYRVIMEMRSDSGFSNLAKKINAPKKPASMDKPASVPAPAPAPKPTSAPRPVSLPVTLPVTMPTPPAISPEPLKRKAPEEIVKQEIIDVDDDDEEPEAAQSDYDPEEEAATVQRERRAKKRQRTGDVATPVKQSADEEDLEYQLEELKLKSQLAESQLRRKIAAAKRRNAAEAAAK